MYNAVRWARGLFIALSPFITALPSEAETASCPNATSQFDLNRCAAVELKQADTELNKGYAQVLTRLDVAGKMRLRKAQRAWVVFRDKQCAFESNGTDGGSISPMVAMKCATGLTITRAHVLASFGKCTEGDVSCPR